MLDNHTWELNGNTWGGGFNLGGFKHKQNKTGGGVSPTREEEASRGLTRLAGSLGMQIF